MDIGTAKPSKEQLAELQHHMIDIIEPYESFSLGRYIELTDQVIANLKNGNKGPIIAAGGTAMYLRGLLEGIFDGPSADIQFRNELMLESDKHGSTYLYERLIHIDPEAASKIHYNDLKRIIRALEVYHLTGKPFSEYQVHFRSGNYRYPWQIIGIRREKEEANKRINARVKKMVESGLFNEVRQLLDEPNGISKQASQAVGYAEVIDYFKGKCERDEAIEKIKINSRRLAKHQRTWFRGFMGVKWYDIHSETNINKLALKVIEDIQKDT